MRITLAAAALGLATVATQGIAQDTRGQRASANDVTLQITARGSIDTPADDVTAIVAVSGTGATDAAAVASVQAKLGTMRSALAAAGVTAITVLPDTGLPFGINIDDSMTDDGTGKPSKTAKRNVQIKLPSTAKLQDVQTILARQDIESVGSPTFALTDDAPARQAAIVKAVAKARADADAYAATVGMRVLRITRMTNLSPQLIDIDQAEFAKRIASIGGGGPTDVTTSATVSIEFVIGTR